MIKELLIAWIATVGFAVIYNIPKKSLVYAGLCGSVGWGIHLWVNEGLRSSGAAAFVGALAVGIMGEILARWLKKPVTVYVIPGILPLVPGYGLYRAMEKIILKEYALAADTGFRALLVALAIASGIIIASSCGKYYNEWLSTGKRKQKISV